MQLYTTSTATTLKLKHDVKRMKELLDAKKVVFEEVGLRSTASFPKHGSTGRQQDEACESPYVATSRWTSQSSQAGGRR